MGLDEASFECHCGAENFERVIVQRRPHAPIVTDFVACVACRAMYFAPRDLTPIDDSAPKRDAGIAARLYRKPGRR